MESIVQDNHLNEWLSGQVSAEMWRRFVLAGNAIFTIVSGKSNEHRTYKVCKGTDRYSGKDIWFVKVLTGPDNRSDYTCVSRIVNQSLDPDESRLAFVRNRKYQNAPSNEIFAWLWVRTASEQGCESVDRQCKIYHSGKCAKCGRLLTDDQSITRGFGAVCWAAINE